MIEAIGAALVLASLSVIGAAIFGDSKRLHGWQRFVIPTAVGMFLSLVLLELVPETILSAPEWGGVVIAVGFLAFYGLARVLHNHFHHLEAADCSKKSAAGLMLVGDGVHNISDGVVIGAAFMVDPAIGVATTLAVALHEVPQEIIEFGVLVRAGYSRVKAAAYNFLSALSVVLGVVAIYIVAEVANEYVWVLTGLAAGNLLYLAASDMLPRVHGGVEEYGGAVRSSLVIAFGFVIMALAISVSHGELGHEHGRSHGHEHSHEEVHLEEHEGEDYGHETDEYLVE